MSRPRKYPEELLERGVRLALESADDLRRKDFFGSAILSESDVLSSGFVDEYARICRAGAQRR
jgi:hypothetical protein